MAEAFYALELLLQLSFNEKVQQDMKQTKSLPLILRNLVKACDSKVQNRNEQKLCLHIKNQAEKVFWNLSENEKKVNDDDGPDGVKRGEKQLMLSFCPANEEICLKVKQRLEELDVKVYTSQKPCVSWDHVRGNIDASQLFLMCVSEKYRQSNDCQLEAKHASSHNKRMVALIMQQGHDSLAGWMGKIVSSNGVCVDFSKYDFEECINQLKHILLSRLQFITVLSRNK